MAAKILTVLKTISLGTITRVINLVARLVSLAGIFRPVVVRLYGLIVSIVRLFVSAATGSKTTGVARVEAVVASFEAMVTALETAKQEIDQEITDNAERVRQLQEQIDQINGQTDDLDRTYEKAEKVAANIQGLVQ